MRKSLKTILYFLFVFLTINCQKDYELSEKNDSITKTIYKNKVIDYINKLNIKFPQSNKNQIISLEIRLDLNSIVLKDLETTEDLLIANLSPDNTFSKSSTYVEKCIFYLNNGRIVRSKIVKFESNLTNFNKYDDLLISILNREEKYYDYTGKVSLYGLNNKLVFSDHFISGQFVGSQNVQMELKNSNKQIKGLCTNWYLVTYVGGNVTNVEYLYTTCNHDKEEADPGEYDTGGGGSSSSGTTTTGPTFPANPYNNQIYDYTDEEGKYTRYKYNATTNFWEIVKVVLPQLTIQANVFTGNQQYVFLNIWNIPNNTQIIHDGYVYIFDLASITWTGYPILTPCQAAKNRTANTSFSAQQNLLSQNYNLNHETGFKQNANGTFVALSNSNNGTNVDALDFEITTNTIGASHVHTNSYTNASGDENHPIHMLSPADLARFLRLISNCYGQGVPSYDAYVQMTSSSGTYNFTYDGTPQNFINFISNMSIDLKAKTTNDIYIKYVERYGLESGLLKFIKENCNLSGLKLVKTETNGTVKTLSLDGTGNLVTTTCN